MLCVEMGVEVCTKEYHESLKQDEELWLSLTTYVGIQRAGGLPGGDLELRNCILCQSTLALKVSE